MGLFSGLTKTVKHITEGIEDLLTFAAIFIFGMIIIGEFYGLYTYPSVKYLGLRSPFYYPIYIAIFLLVVRILDDLIERK